MKRALALALIALALAAPASAGSVRINGQEVQQSGTSMPQTKTRNIIISGQGQIITQQRQRFSDAIIDGALSAAGIPANPAPQTIIIYQPNQVTVNNGNVVRAAQPNANVKVRDFRLQRGCTQAFGQVYVGCDLNINDREQR